MTVPARYTLTEAHFIIAQQERALRMIGYSATTGQPRFGPKAQAARWGLGEDTLPEEYASLGIPDNDEAVQAIYDRGYVDGLDDGYGEGAADLARDMARGK